MSRDVDPVEGAAQDAPDAELFSADAQADPILGLSEETRRIDLVTLFRGAVKAALELVLEEELREIVGRAVLRGGVPVPG